MDQEQYIKALAEIEYRKGIDKNLRIPNSSLTTVVEKLFKLYEGDKLKQYLKKAHPGRARTLKKEFNIKN